MLNKYEGIKQVKYFGRAQNELINTDESHDKLYYNFTHIYVKFCSWFSGKLIEYNSFTNCNVNYAFGTTVLILSLQENVNSCDCLEAAVD